MLSAQQDATRISMFFDRWLQDFKRPKEVTIDESAALKRSCVRSFALCNGVNEYLKMCFEVLKKKSKDLPKCYIRLDDAHYIKTLFRRIGKILKKSPAKHFYLRCIGVIMKCENFNEIQQIVIHMINVANGVEDCEKSFETLSKLTKTHNMDDLLEEDATDRVRLDDESDVSLVHPATWFDELLESIKIPKKPKHIQDYYNPALNAFFKKVFDDLPLWSAVMKIDFKSKRQLATSNDTKARFQVIKNVIFRDYSLPIRPDKFIQIMLENMSAMTKLNRLSTNTYALMKQKTMKKEVARETQTQQSVDETSDLEEEKFPEIPFENWRNRGAVKTNTKKTRSHRAQTSILNPQVIFKSIVYFYFFENLSSFFSILFFFPIFLMQFLYTLRNHQLLFVF